MRLILAALLLLLPPAAGAEARMRISVDAASRTALVASPLGEGTVVDVSVRGRGSRHAPVQLSARCAHGPCAAIVWADRRGRFHARLHVLLAGSRTRLGLRVRYADTLDLPTSRLVVRTLTPPAWAQAPPYAAGASAPRLTTFGDSLSVGTAAPLRAVLPEWRVTHDGRVGRPLAEGMALLSAARSLLTARPSVLAFSLFTNDDPRAIESLDAAVRASVAALAPRSCAVWATIARPKVDGMSYRLVNERLHALADEIGDSLQIVDWAAAVREHPEWLAPDRVHATPEGYVERARLFAAAALRCHELHGW